MNDSLTIIFYTANHISDYFMGNVIKQLKKSAGDIPIISVSQKPMRLGDNYCIGDIGRSVFNIYTQVLMGAQKAKTKYIATTEDDVLYPPEHFDYRPKDDVFAYDTAKWGIYTWSKPPIFSYKERRNMTSLICNRKALIRTLEERFVKYPNPNNIDTRVWGEPGRYEKHLGITEVKSERFEANVPHIMFSTQKALSWEGLGNRKKHGVIRAYDIPFWGRADDIIQLYR